MRSLLFDDYCLRSWIVTAGVMALISSIFYGVYLLEQADAKEMR